MSISGWGWAQCACLECFRTLCSITDTDSLIHTHPGDSSAMFSPLHRPPLFELRNVSRYYETPSGTVRALDRLDCTIQVGEFIGIVGRSGSGKSTLLNVMTG